MLGVILDISSVSSTDSVNAIVGRFAALDRLANSLCDQFTFRADVPNGNRYCNFIISAQIVTVRTECLIKVNVSRRLWSASYGQSSLGGFKEGEIYVS